MVNLPPIELELEVAFDVVLRHPESGTELVVGEVTVPIKLQPTTEKGSPDGQ